ncbi:MAG: type II secretion system protein, partial [Clostridia bacterium]|nr:type II secretion system protein [Clostridia bacterium]
MNLKTNNKRTQKGITLIALVVTIVVLLILAGVSINAIFSENGIINRAKDAQNKMDQATQNDMTG